MCLVNLGSVHTGLMRLISPFFILNSKPNVMDERLGPLLHVLYLSDSNISPESRCHEVFRAFSQYYQQIPGL
jgi:hypothetical protein